MAKTSPEKLAAALKANIKRRKAARVEKPAAKEAEQALKPVKKPGFP